MNRAGRLRPGEKVLAVGLDAADPLLLERWMDAGWLPCLAGLRRAGAWLRVTGPELFETEASWLVFNTGCGVETLDYWQHLTFDPARYQVAESAARADLYGDFPPFYAYGPERRVAVFDLPWARPHAEVSGLELLDWGSLGPFPRPVSRPAELLPDVLARHGSCPTRHREDADGRDPRSLRRLAGLLRRSLERRVAIIRELLAREPWDLFLTVFSEPHIGGHGFWHLSGERHQQEPAPAVCDLLLRLYRQVDRALAALLAAAGERTLVVFSVHGMGPNHADLNSQVFLPELLYRFAFGRPGLAWGGSGALAPPSLEPLPSALAPLWESARGPARPLVDLASRGLRPLERFLRGRDLPVPFARADLDHPYALMRRADTLFWAPARWYAPSWPAMPAFALPSYSQGRVRLNLRGREAQGTVAPERRAALSERLEGVLRGLRDARTGRRVVRDVVPGPDATEADLLVVWEESLATDCVDAPGLGRIGPVPYLRSGSHRNRGFFAARGPGIVPGSRGEGRVRDLGATFSALLDRPPRGKGVPLLERACSSV